MNENAVKSLCDLLEKFAETSIVNNQKLEALETLLKRDKDFASAYSREWAKAQFGSTVPDMKTAVGKLRSELVRH